MVKNISVLIVNSIIKINLIILLNECSHESTTIYYKRICFSGDLFEIEILKGEVNLFRSAHTIRVKLGKWFVFLFDL